MRDEVAEKGRILIIKDLAHSVKDEQEMPSFLLAFTIMHHFI